METSSTICTAQFVKRAVLEQAISCVTRAEAQAERTKSEAFKEIAMREDELAQKVEEFECKVAKAEEDAFQAFLDVKTIQQRAEDAVEVLDFAARYKAEVSEMAPVLAGLVATCLERIIGRLDAADVLAATVGEAVSELATQGALRLRVAPCDYESINAMVSDAKERFAAVTAVQPDASLKSGTILLDGQGGFVDISHQAQIEAVRAALLNAPQPSDDPQ